VPEKTRADIFVAMVGVLLIELLIYMMISAIYGLKSCINDEGKHSCCCCQ